MNNLETKLLEATKNILEKNLKISDEKIVLVYDRNSILSEKISEAYIKNIKNIENKNSNFIKKILKNFWFEKANFEIIDFDKIDKEKLKEKLLNLPEWSTVILVQSTNFRLDKFRIRLNLHNRWIWCLEHNHLSYIKDHQLENYADAIKFRSPYYDAISAWLKEKADKADEIIFECHDWSKLIWTWWFEDMKQNTWNYDWKKRWSTFPVWENFTEIKNFDNLNWELSIYTFPWWDFQIIESKPFKIRIKKSKVYKIEWENYPKEFLEIYEKILKREEWEVFLRELWFGLNPWINRKNKLSDVNAHERIEWFHISIWKKHNIYLKKIHKKIPQKFHIDIFPDTKAIYFKTWDKLEKIFESKILENWEKLNYEEKYLFPDREKFWE
jgi:aminopeptidase